jgi:hypothetical protein
VATRMLLQVGLKLLAPIAVLHGVPESKIESFRGDFLGGVGVAGLGGESAAASSRVRASEAKVPSGYCEVGFEFGRAAVPDAVPKRELEGDLIVGGEFGDGRRGGRRIR